MSGIVGEGVDAGYFVVLVHSGCRAFIVVGPVTLDDERLLTESVRHLQSKGHAIGIGVDEVSATIEEAAGRARAATKYKCVGAWPVDQSGEAVSIARIGPKSVGSRLQQPQAVGRACATDS